MGTLIVYPFADGTLRSASVTEETWNDRREQPTGVYVANAANTSTSGMTLGYWLGSTGGIYQAFMKFDTSEMADKPDVIRTARLRTTQIASWTYGPIAYRARIHHWPIFDPEAAIQRPDGTAWVPASQLGALPLFNTASSVSGYWTAASGGADLVNRTGVTSVMAHATDQQLTAPPYDSNNFQTFYRITATDPAQHPFLELRYGGTPDAVLLDGLHEGVYVSPSTGKRYLLARETANSARLGAWVNTDDQ